MILSSYGKFFFYHIKDWQLTKYIANKIRVDYNTRFRASAACMKVTLAAKTVVCGFKCWSQSPLA